MLKKYNSSSAGAWRSLRMTPQRKNLLWIFLLILAHSSSAQTYLINPSGDGGFESGTTFAANGWTTVNTSNNALWQIGTAATGYSGARGAFVGPSATSYTYTTSTSRTSHFYRDITVPVGATGISLSWSLRGRGETGWDRLLVYRAPTTVTPVANSPASSSTTLSGATLIYTQTTLLTSYATQTVSLPVSLAGTTFRLIFTWQNDASLGSTPPAAVDNISLTYIPAVTCSGTPSGISVSSTQTFGCTTYSPTLSLTGATASGLTFQWQSSPTGSTWTNVSGATNATYVPTVTTSIYYRCVVTCTSSGLSFNTSGVNLVYSSTAPIPYTESFEGITTANTLPSCMAATNLGSLTRTYLAATGSYNQAAHTGTKFASFRYGCNDWFFTPAFALTAGNTYVFSFWYVTDGYSGWSTLQAKYGTSQSAAAMATAIGTPITSLTNTSYAQYSGTFTATSSGNFYIGINCVGNSVPWYLTIDDLNLTTLPVCTGTPTPGTVSSTISTGCGTVTPTLSLSGATSGVSGLSYQWQSSPDGTAWSNISGATTATYAPAVSGTTHYRNILSCGAANATSPGTIVSINPVPAAIAGGTSVCISGTTSLSSATSGGTWSSSSAAISIGVSSGVATGVSNGTAIISYNLPTGCRATQVMNVNTVVPTVSASASPNVICSGGNTTLTANPTSALPGYVMSAVPYSFVTPVSPATASFTSIDDGYATVTIPFTFNFFGTNYTTVYIGTNGYLTFGSSTTSLSTYSIPTASMPACIAYAMGDLYVASPGTVTYATNGTAPNRIFVVTFSQIGNCCSYSDTYNAQIRLYESTNTIEIMVSKSSGTRTIGIQNTGGSVGYAPAGRNAANYTITPATPEGYRFEVPQASYTWSPSTYLASTTGLSVSANSVTATPTMVFTVTRTFNGCSTNATTTVSVNPLPAAISGASEVCEGLTTALSNATAGGTWQSSAPANGTINSSTGVVTGIAAGTTNISYTLSSTGCRSTKVMTINPIPAPITGTASVCSGASSTLANVTAGGAWSSGTPAVAAIAAGVVTGGTAGVAMITYTLPTGCLRTREATVNPLPSINLSPASPTVCLGDSIAITASSPALEFSLLNQDFNSGLGLWAITTPIDPADGISPWALVSSSSMGIGGDGTAMVEAAPSASSASGLTKTYLTSPGFSTVGFGSANLTFNEHLFSSVFSDINVKVQYSIDGGTTWTTLIDQMPTSGLDTVVGSGDWDAEYPEVSVPLPGAALNVPDVRLRWYYETNWGGWWEVDNIAVKAALPAATFTWAGVSGATGLSCTNCATPVITPASVGANVYNVTASSTCSSNTSVTVNVNPLPGNIGGATATLCVGSTISLSNPDAGGTWTSGDGSIAAVDAVTGVVTGIDVGTVLISYTMPNTCSRIVTINVDPLPTPVLGTLQVCEGLTTSLSHATSGGVWSSSATNVSIDASGGAALGTTVGSAVVTYVLPSGCKITAEVTVNQLPSVITGTPFVCENATTMLASTPSGGSWNSGNTSIAAFTSGGGEMSGIAAGTTTVTYTLPTGCTRTRDITVNAVPADIAGSLTVCEGSTTSLDNATSGGAWIDGGVAQAVVNFDGVVSGILAGTAPISYVLPNGCQKTVLVTVNQTPAAISGTPVVCEDAITALSSTPLGGNWSSNNTAVADFTTGIGDMTGVSAGTATVSYTLSTGCMRSVSVTVNALPANITGTLAVCEESATTLSNTTPGGTWGSGLTANADFVSGPGVLNGYVAGSVTVSYTLSTGCFKTAQVTVNQTPAPINGIKAVCEGSTTDLNTTPLGGSWSSGSVINAEVDAVSGIVSGVFQGVTPITYSLSTGCLRTADVTVNALPADIGGGLEVCQGLTTNLGNITPGGVWTSSNIAIADVDAGGVTLGVADGTARITYTIASTGCYKNSEITVNPLPADIAGNLQVCEGLTTALGNITPGGSWLASPSVIAAVSASGMVSAYSAGSEVITYKLMATGCQKTATVVVNPLPADIAGSMQVCEGLTTSLTNTTGGGTWSGGDPLVATIDGSGLVDAVNAGTTTVTYTLTSTGCLKTAGVLVNPLPADIAGPDQVCEGSTVTLTNATPGGAWSSLSANGPVDAGGVVTGNTAGSATIVYALPTGCLKTAGVLVNPLPEPITGTFEVCETVTTSLSNLTPGGTWSSSSILNASIDGDGVVTGIAAGNSPVTYMLPTGCLRSENVTVNALPADIGGIAQVCEGLTTTLSNTTVDGAWSTDAPAIADIDAAGIVSGFVAGNAHVTYTLLTGCAKSVAVTVNALPDAITGAVEVCEGLSASLVNTTPSGTWVSATPAIADVDLSTGLVTGVNAGTSDISYVLPTGCVRTVPFTVKALPADIAGATQVCEGLTTAMSDPTADGAWSSSDILKASVDATGVVTGGAAGMADIIYTLPNGCFKSVSMLVNPVPDDIIGVTDVCEGSTTGWTNSTAGGIWASSDVATADVDILSGIVSGITSGTATITYALMTGCLKAADITVNALPGAISGTLDVCQGLTTALSSIPAGGSWSVSSPDATVDAVGNVTGVAAGSADVAYTLSTGCSRTVNVMVNPLPVVYNITGGGEYCAGTGGVTIDGDGSDVDIAYQLYNGAAMVGGPIVGGGSSINFGMQSGAGTYTVLATDILTGCVNGMAGSATVTILPLNIPSVSVASGSGTTVCAGTTVTYNAAPVNGGTLPAYTWEVNGIVMPAATSSVFNYTPVNGDVVKVTLTSNEICAIPSTAADMLSMTVDANQTPVATISLPPGVLSVCDGSNITLTATSLYGGTAPVYDWFVDGTLSATGPAFTYAPGNGDLVTSKLTSNYTCLTVPDVMSNTLTMVTDPVYIPVVNIGVSPGTSVPAGTTVTFTAMIGGTAGPSPSFQWYKNNTAIAGATNATYMTSSLNNNDSVSCQVIGTSPCGYESFNSVLMRVKATGVGQLSGNPGNISLVPNPNKGDFIVKGHLAAATDEELSVEVTNMFGQIVYKAKTTAKGGNINERIQLNSNLANGMYMLNLRSGEEGMVFHFVLEQ